MIAASKAVLVASGTAALESVLTGRPTVAAYKMNPWTYRLVKSKVKPVCNASKFSCESGLIPELIQEKASVESIVDAILPVLKESPANQFLTEAQKIYDSLAGDVSGRAAEAILEQLS